MLNWQSQKTDIISLSNKKWSTEAARDKEKYWRCLQFSFRILLHCDTFNSIPHPSRVIRFCVDVTATKVSGVIFVNDKNMWSNFVQLWISRNSLSCRSLQPVKSNTSSSGVFRRNESEVIVLSDRSNQYRYLHLSKEPSIIVFRIWISKLERGNNNLLKQLECCNILSRSDDFTASSMSNSKKRHSIEFSSISECSRFHVLLTTWSKNCRSNNLKIDTNMLSGSSVNFNL